MSDLSWMGDASCTRTDPEAFFPEYGANTTTLSQAKRVCMGCEVRAECLDYALDTGQEFGVWGGLSTRQRTRLRHSRQSAEAA